MELSKSDLLSTHVLGHLLIPFWNPLHPPEYTTEIAEGFTTDRKKQKQRRWKKILTFTS